MAPIQPDGLNPGHCRQLSNLLGCGLYDEGATEIVSPLIRGS
jgi:hypothetical protein